MNISAIDVLIDPTQPTDSDLANVIAGIPYIPLSVYQTKIMELIKLLIVLLELSSILNKKNAYLALMDA